MEMQTQIKVDDLRFTEILFKKYNEDISIYEIRALLSIYRNLDLPYKLLREIKDFVRRNLLSVTIDDITYSTDRVCVRCLKAFIYKKAKEYKLTDYATRFLLRNFECGIGHNSYYADQGKLIDAC